jgi:quinol monooxygenase YgiN
MQSRYCVKSICVESLTPNGGDKMIHIIWEFNVHSDRVEKFLQHYSSEGTWAQLFQKSAAFKETLLERDVDSPLRFITIDKWADRSGFEDFKRTFQAEYAALDRRCESLTESDHCLGMFESL